MHVAVAHTTLRDTGAAFADVWGKLTEALGGAPHWVLAQGTVAHAAPALAEAAARQGVPLHGGTTCQGFMTPAGFCAEAGYALGLWGVRDEDGGYGVGASSMGADPREAARAALRQALERAERYGEVPALVWVGAAPGHEEEVIAGLEGELGGGVPIVGGSSADDTVEGNWAQFTDGGAWTDAVVVSVLFPSTDVTTSFQSGYAPTETQGRVTRAEGRVVWEIDGRPAAEVYDGWTGGQLREAMDSGGLLAASTLFPWGRVVGQVDGLPYFRLAHPAGVVEGGGVSVFADVAEGEDVVLMQGTVEGLKDRAGRVATEALAKAGWSPEDAAGALVVFCAGCMLTVREDVEAVVRSLREALPGVPFLAEHTFGEQGCLQGGENRHGNLMISVTVFQRG